MSLAGMLRGSFSSECMTNTPTLWNHTLLSLFFSLLFGSVWELVALLRVFLIICFLHYVFPSCFMRKKKKISLSSPFFFPCLLFHSNHSLSLCPLHPFYRFLSLFALYFPLWITSCLFCVLALSAWKYHLLLTLRNAYNSARPCLQTAPHKRILFLSKRYLKSHCAHTDKPEQHKAPDNVSSSKLAAVEAEVKLLLLSLLW